MPPDAGRDGYEFLAINANKKCITLNLKHPEGREIFERLLAQSDVLVENFAPARWTVGLSYEELKNDQPEGNLRGGARLWRDRPLRPYARFRADGTGIGRLGRHGMEVLRTSRHEGARDRR